jgi:hypothetical protein
MNWIKKNPAPFALALVSALVLALAFLLYTSYSSFAGTFTGSQGNPSLNKKAPELSTEEIDATIKAVPQPATWVAPVEPAPSGKEVRLFVSDNFVLKSGKIARPEGGMFFPPVINEWFEKYKISYLEPSCLSDDPDRDGFANELEYLGIDTLPHRALTEPHAPIAGLSDDSTNPTDVKSHPPYHTRLQLAQVVQIPFNLRFMAIDINPRNKNDITAQINAGGKTMYVPVPGEIGKTKYKTKGFQKKEAPGQDGVQNDISELTVTNTETGKDLVLILGRDTNSPDSYAVVRYLWVAPGGTPTADMSLKKGLIFHLEPEKEKNYVIEAIGPDSSLGLAEREVLVKLPDGGKYKLKVESK